MWASISQSRFSEFGNTATCACVGEGPCGGPVKKTKLAPAVALMMVGGTTVARWRWRPLLPGLHERCLPKAKQPAAKAPPMSGLTATIQTCSGLWRENTGVLEQTDGDSVQSVGIPHQWQAQSGIGARTVGSSLGSSGEHVIMSPEDQGQIRRDQMYRLRPICCQIEQEAEAWKCADDFSSMGSSLPTP